MCEERQAFQAVIILRKEVIQPQVPLRLPCYDLVPIIKLTFAACVLAVRSATSSPPNYVEFSRVKYSNTSSATLWSYGEPICEVNYEICVAQDIALVA